jgi:hypothetical protein
MMQLIAVGSFPFGFAQGLGATRLKHTRAFALAQDDNKDW